MLTHGEFTAAFQQVKEADCHYESARDAEGKALTSYLLGACYRRLNDLPASLAKHGESFARYLAQGDTEGCANALRARSGTLRLLGRDDEAIQDLVQCREIYQQLGKHLEEMRTLMNLSILHKQSGDLAASQELLYTCLAFFEAGGYTTETAKVLLNIAGNYQVLDDPAESVRYAQRGIPLFEATEDLHNLSMAINVLGVGYMNLKDYENALLHMRRGLEIAERVGIQWTIAIILGNIGQSLMELKRFDEARVALERGRQINGGDGNRLAYCDNLQRLGTLFSHPENSGRDLKTASAYLEEARQIAEEQDTATLLMDIHRARVALYEELGDFQKALEAFRAFHAAEKQIFNEESDKRIKRLEIEKAKKDAEIAHLRMVELAQALEETERLRLLADEWAHTDALTGVSNRRALEEYLEDEIERSRRYGHPLTLALVDIDHFKKINDTLGHATGDATLIRVAQILRENCRSGDRVARYGGEEFALIFPETDLPTAISLCERLREIIASANWSEVHSSLSSVTASIGVSPFLDEHTNGFTASDALLIVADMHLYEAKRNGRNRVAG